MVLNLEEIGFLCYLFCLQHNFLNYIVLRFNLEIIWIYHAHNFLLTLWDFSSWLIVLIMFLFENVILLDNLSNLFWVSEILSSRYFSTVKNRELVFCIFMMKWGLLIDQKSFNWSSNMSKGINIPPYWPNDDLIFLKFFTFWVLIDWLLTFLFAFFRFWRVLNKCVFQIILNQLKIKFYSLIDFKILMLGIWLFLKLIGLINLVLICLFVWNL